MAKNSEKTNNGRTVSLPLVHKPPDTQATSRDMLVRQQQDFSSLVEQAYDELSKHEQEREFSN